MHSVPVVLVWYSPVPADLQPIWTDTRDVQLDSGQVMVQDIPLLSCMLGHGASHILSCMEPGIIFLQGKVMLHLLSEWEHMGGTQIRIHFSMWL